MLKLGRYTRAEMAQILGTNVPQNMRDKLERYNVDFQCEGKRKQLTFTITAINRPFKVYAITELGCDANTDFRKLAYYYYYFFNDENFAAMPDEVKSLWMDKSGHSLSRQTIAKYTAILESKEMICKSRTEFVYYFAHNSQQFYTTPETYKEAWHDYWEMIEQGYYSGQAIRYMINTYGGVARKQSMVDFNGLYTEEINYMNQLVLAEIEKDAANQF